MIRLMLIAALLLCAAGVSALLDGNCEHCVGEGVLLRAVEPVESRGTTLVLVWQSQDSVILNAQLVQPHPKLVPGRFYEVWLAPDGTVSIH